MSSIQGIIISPYAAIITSTNQPSTFEAELAALGFRTTTITITAAKEAVWRSSPLSAAIGIPVKMTWLDTTLTPSGTTIEHATAPNNPMAAKLLRPVLTPVLHEQPALLKGDILLVREDGGEIEAAQVALLCEFAGQVSLPDNGDLGEKMFAEEFEKLREAKVDDSGCSAQWVDVVNPVARMKEGADKEGE